LPAASSRSFSAAAFATAAAASSRACASSRSSGSSSSIGAAALVAPSSAGTGSAVTIVAPVMSIAGDESAVPFR